MASLNKLIRTLFAETDLKIGSIANLGELQKRCDALRTSGNVFCALRLDRMFEQIRTRTVNPLEEGTRLVEAAKAQSEFRFRDVAGTLVGLWSPGFSSAFSVEGYHFHFLSEERPEGGHLLDCESGPLRSVALDLGRPGFQRLGV